MKAILIGLGVIGFLVASAFAFASDTAADPKFSCELGEGEACIIVTKDTDPEDDDFQQDSHSFDVDPGPVFSLEDDETEFVRVTPAPGGQNYVIQETPHADWMLEEIECRGDIDRDDVEIDYGSNSVELNDVEAGDVIECLFTNIPVPEPTPEPTVEPTPEPPTITLIECLGNVLVTTVNGEIVLIEEGHPNCVTPTPEPPVVIRPPNTGDAGLK